MSEQQENIQVQDYCNELCVRRSNPLAICDLCNALAARHRFERFFLGGFLIRRVKKAEQTRNNTPISVNPTGPAEQYADIAISGIFNAHVAVINSERQAIWQRYQAMLIANSIIFQFLARQSNLKWEEILFGGIFGLLLCTWWLIMTASGWTIIETSERVACRFCWPTLGRDANPFPIQEEHEGKSKGGWIYRTAILTIIIFMVSYLFLLVNYFYIQKYQLQN